MKNNGKPRNGNYIEISDGLSDGDTVYVEAQTQADAAGGLLSSLFGGQQFNQPGGNMPGGGSFDPGSMGERGNWGGRDGSSGGNRPSMGGGNG